MTEAANEGRFWTNPSVKTFAAGGDPIARITEEAKALVFRAVQDRWQGPPFDPFWMAQYRGISVVQRTDIQDARLVTPPKGKPVIEYNPNQPYARMRFSIAHEIGHTLFSDYRETTRNRQQLLRGRTDNWQLELLCNLAAAEILMPSVPILDELGGDVTLAKLMSLWKKYDVSSEAFLIRTASVTNQQISIFAAARSGDQSGSDYRLDYCIPSSSSAIKLPPGLVIRNGTVLDECTKPGFTAKGVERWAGTEMEVECVGVPPYRGRTFPRVVGLLRERDKASVESLKIRYLRGDVTEPRGRDSRIVAHIVNDKASTWGAGAALAIARRWPSAHSDFKNWSIARREEFDLGVIHEFRISGNLWIVSMVAQHGYGESLKPRIRYAALRACLRELSKFAYENHATVHMPRIGTGFAGGNWEVIENLVIETLISRGVKVLVYDLPDTKDPSQSFLDSSLELLVT